VHSHVAPRGWPWALSALEAVCVLCGLQAVPPAMVTNMLSLCMAVGTIGRITGPLWGGNASYSHGEVYVGMLVMALVGCGECTVCRLRELWVAAHLALQRFLLQHYHWHLRLHHCPTNSCAATGGVALSCSSLVTGPGGLLCCYFRCLCSVPGIRLPCAGGGQLELPASGSCQRQHKHQAPSGCQRACPPSPVRRGPG
jgi:hypothetical protein